MQDSFFSMLAAAASLHVATGKSLLTSLMLGAVGVYGIVISVIEIRELLTGDEVEE